VNTSDDPYLPLAKEALQAFSEGYVGPEAALAAIWDAMRSAVDAGFPGQPYVDLSDLVTFPEEGAPEDGEQAAAWAAEVASQEPGND